MREVASVRQVETHERVARFEHGEEHGHVGLGARVGLHVGVLGTVEFAEALDGQALHLIDHFAAAVVAGRGITLGVLVGQHRPHGLHHLVAHEVFRGDQLDAFHLACALLGDKIEDLCLLFHMEV